MEVIVPIQSNKECRESGYGATRITDNMLCAGFKEGKKDSCQVLNENSLLHFQIENKIFCRGTVVVLAWLRMKLDIKSLG